MDKHDEKFENMTEEIKYISQTFEQKISELMSRAPNVV
jgi:uncharacterized protein YdhG (YjbR/CyaY superfamily)